MRAAILALGALTLASAAQADQTGAAKTGGAVRPAPVFGTPQTSKDPAQGHDIGGARGKTGGGEGMGRTVVRQGGSVSVEVGGSPRD